MEGIEKIKEKVYKHPESSTVHIARVPNKTKDVFIKFANEEYVGDYGMALKYLVDNVLIIPDKFEGILKVMYELEQRVEKLENKKTKSNKRKRLDGSGGKEK